MEGIETEMEALISMESGIDFVQGYYFGRPEPTLGESCATSRSLQELCDMFGIFSAAEAQKYHRVLAPYVESFRYSASLIESGAAPNNACAEFLGKARVERCYVLDGQGGQCGESLVALSHPSEMICASHRCSMPVERSGRSDIIFSVPLDDREKCRSAVHIFQLPALTCA